MTRPTELQEAEKLGLKPRALDPLERCRLPATQESVVSWDKLQSNVQWS